DTSAAEAALAEAKQKAQEAEAAKQNADKNNDGIISDDEKAAVNKAIEAAETAKTNAETEIGKLPGGSFKTDLAGQAQAISIPNKV
ncbi:GA-like domain-containing protein, partial [Gallibacterium anatis]